MPWVRIDQNAMHHPKIGGLSDGAFRLWVEGLAYCQTYLTDGLITDRAMRALKAYSPKRRDALQTAHLWDLREAGIVVHDFLDWNDSRELVEQKRRSDRDRKRRLSDRNPIGFPPRKNASFPSDVCRSVGLSSEERTSDPAYESPSRPNGVKPARALEPDAPTPPNLGERAGRFIERYGELYEKHRKGAKLVIRPAFDYQEALTLVRTWDDERLDKLVTVWLTTDHDFAERGSRTIAQFRSMASWCDGRLREKGL